MGNQASVTAAAAAKDVISANIYVSFATADGGGQVFDVVQANEVVLSAGDAPSYANCWIPMKRFGEGFWDETGDKLALRNAAKSLMLNTRASAFIADPAGKKHMPLVNGVIRKIGHDLGNDALYPSIADDKFILGKFTCFGRVTLGVTSQNTEDGSEETFAFFDSSAPLIFNLGGWPDCVDMEDGRVVFAPCHRYGYTQASDIEPAPGAAIRKARTWRCIDALKYLRDLFYMSGRFFYQIKGGPDFGADLIPTEWIDWPIGSCQIIGSSRTLNNFSVQNNSLLMALSKVARKAGAYSLYMEAKENGRSELRLMDMAANDESQQMLVLPGNQTSDLGTLLRSQDVIQGGYIEEDMTNYFHDVVIAGDPPIIESLHSTNSDSPATITSLLQAWSDSDEADFKAFITENGNTQDAFNAACRTWPNVYCAYTFNSDAVPPFKDTKWGGGFAGGFIQGQAKFLAFLISGKNITGSTNPRDWLNMDVIVEYKDPSDGWKPCQRYDNFQLSGDGRIIRFQALRDAETPQTWTSGGSGWNGAAMAKLDIRMTIAIQHEDRITGRAGAGEGSEDGSNPPDPRGTASRVNQLPAYTYLAVAEPGDYVEWLRKNSYPYGTDAFLAEKTAQDFPDRATQGAEVFTDRLSSKEGRIVEHAKARLRDVKTVENPGNVSLSGLSPTLRPGKSVVIEGEISIKAVCKSVKFSPMTQVTGIELVAFDDAGIYDKNSKAEASRTASPAGGTWDAVQALGAQQVQAQAAAKRALETQDEPEIIQGRGNFQ